MRICVFFVLLALPGWCAPLGSLSGLWVLDGFERDGKHFSDPRWAARLDLTGSGLLTFSSQSVTEVRLSNGKTRTTTDNLTLRGQARVVEGKLEIRWEENPAGEELLKANFGVPDKNRVVRLPYQESGSLRLEGPNRTLIFVRNERPLKP